MKPLACKTLAATAGVVALAGCAVTSAPSCNEAEQPAVQETLYLGTAKPDGLVSAPEWAGFVDTVITPRFPGGFTLSHATGQWQSLDGTIVHEPSHILDIVHPGDERSAVAVREIIDIYKTQFRQEAVLRVRSPACISF